MENSKRFFYEYEEYDEGGKGPETMIDDIMADADFPHLNEIIIGCWGNAWEDSCQPIIDGLISHADAFSHIERLFMGDMDFEDCEVSWIIQGDYSRLWGALPNLKELTVKGSTELILGTIDHAGLESLTVICGGLPNSVLESIQNAHLPSLKKLVLYIGVDNYGFEGDADTIRKFLEAAEFPQLTYLGIEDSEIQDELTEVVLESKFMSQLHTLDLSNGTLTDKGGQLLLEKLPSFPNIQKLDVHYHYLSDGMMKKLEALPIETDLDEKNVAENYHGELWLNAMLTE